MNQLDMCVVLQYNYYYYSYTILKEYSVRHGIAFA